MIVVYGTSSSGKSQVAEDIATGLGKDKSLFYVATMERRSAASKDRIKRHRAMRQGKGFVTIEEELDLKKIISKVSGGVVLLECVSNYVANILFGQYGENILREDELEALAESIAEDVSLLDEVCELVVVTNDLFKNYYSTDSWVDGYMRLLARVNILLAKQATTFIEVEMGICNFIKGEKSWQ